MGCTASDASEKRELEQKISRLEQEKEEMQRRIMEMATKQEQMHQEILKYMKEKAKAKVGEENVSDVQDANRSPQATSNVVDDAATSSIGAKENEKKEKAKAKTKAKAIGKSKAKSAAKSASAKKPVARKTEPTQEDRRGDRALSAEEQKRGAAKKEGKASEQSSLELAKEAVDFIFLSAEKVRESTLRSLPCLQEVEQWPGWTQRVPIGLLGCLNGMYVHAILAVSHRWEEPGDPDPNGEQLDAVRTACNTKPGIQWIWYDYWCMYQKQRDGTDGRMELQKTTFKRMLQQVNFLYLGCSVLVLLDMQYYERFWTNYEAYLSMQKTGLNGMEPSSDDPARYPITLLGDGTQELVQGLKKKWTHSAHEADQAGIRSSVAAQEEDLQMKYVIDKLSDDRILVTNKGDKRVQLYKMGELQRQVKNEANLPVESTREKVARLQMVLNDPTDANLYDNTKIAAVVEHWFVQVGNQEYHRFLMCKGVEWGFQYHNFYGDWELSEEDPIVHSRPHYVHNKVAGGYAHLFHCIDLNYNVPRWVIGPAPGDENGWAFCESDADRPWKTSTTWISWDGFQWLACEKFRFVPKEDELDGLSDEEDFLEEDSDGSSNASPRAA